MIYLLFQIIKAELVVDIIQHFDLTKSIKNGFNLTILVSNQ